LIRSHESGRDVMAIKPDALYSFLRQDLAEQIGASLVSFLETMKLPPVGCSHKVAASHSILRSFLKKLEVKGTTERDEAAVSKFLSINNRCELWELQLESSLDEVLIGELKDSLYKFFNPGGLPIDISPLACASFGRCGPGASIGSVGNDSYSKLFSSQLSCTNLSLYHWYRRYISRFPVWLNAESFRYQLKGEPSIVVGSRLSFVPKDDQISRTICTEPSLNMFFQLGLGHILELRLSSFFGIEMDKQPFKNRELAMRGSMGFDYCTIDLSSASDSLSNRMLKCVLPLEVLTELNRYRCRYSIVPGIGQCELHMISTMGNGFTFPLQTILFSCIVRAAMKIAGVQAQNPRGSHSGNWGVFGDDIICPNSCVRYVFRLLQLLGFTVNPDKSFIEGPFRESCGYDCFKGRNIRGVYVKSLDTQQDRIAVINELNLFSMRTGLRLGRTVRALLRTVAWLPVPPSENKDAGIHVPESLGFPRWVDENGSFLYRAWRAHSKDITFGDQVVYTPRLCKARVYNPDGLLTAFTAGWLNSGKVSVRHDRVLYKRKRVVVPFWDFRPTIHSLEWFNWQRWNTAVYQNLTEAR
jgi:hypothetical protein